MTRVLPSEPITERSEANPNQTRNYFQHSIGNRSIVEYAENNKELTVINLMTITYDINDDDYANDSNNHNNETTYFRMF